MATKNTMLKVPYFAKGTKDSLQVALDTGVFTTLDRAAFVFCTDSLEWVMIDTNKQVYTLRGFTESAVKKYVQRGTTLPPVEEGITDVLYVVDDVVYTFDGTEYKPTFNSIQQTLTDLGTSIEQTQTMIGELPEGETVVSHIQNTAQATLTSANEYADTSAQDTLSQANTYADTKAEETLNATKAYTDEQIELHIVLDDDEQGGG